MAPMREQFLDGCQVALTAVSDARVAAGWDNPSALADQSIGSLTAHLARGCWVVGEYLDRGVPAGAVSFATAAAYFAGLMDRFTATDHARVRHRGAEVASVGPAAITTELAEKLPVLRERLAAEPHDRLIEVYGGHVMGLDHYLGTRIVEQVVHLDDLARSLGIEPWENPPDAEALVLGCGAEVGRLRRGGPAMVRALFRDESVSAAGTLPVM